MTEENKVEKVQEEIVMEVMRQTKTSKLTLKECIFFLLAFLLPTGLMALIWGSLGITYGGQVTPLIYDMEIQYMPFFASLRYVLSGENSPFFTWGVALGGNYYGLWAYYMASPLSWITTLFDLVDMPDAIYVLTLLKIGLCGLTFSLFTRFGLSEKRCGMSNVVFSCCYALMSYNIIYGMSLMWMDGVILLPLILLGIEKLLKGKNGVVYFVSVLATFICNYYISYIIGLFAAAYVVCRVVATHSKKEWKRALAVLMRFGVLSFLALGVAMPVLLPALQSISLGKSVENAGYATIPPGAYSFNWWEVFGKLLPGQYDSIENKGLPSIYCGSIMVILAVIYLVRKSHCLKEKICFIVLLLLPVLGFVNQKIDYAYHIFQYPNAFPYRYAFLFSTTILVMAWFGYMGIVQKTDFAKLLVKIGAVYLCVELFLNGSAIVSGLHQESSYGVRSAYDIKMKMQMPLVECIKEEDGFFRTEMGYDAFGLNMALFYGLNGTSGYVSTYNSNVNMFYYVMGAKRYSFLTQGLELTPVADSLLGIRYRVDDKPTRNGYEVKKVSVVKERQREFQLYLHENENALSLGYLVPTDKIYGELTLSANPYENQNIILEALGAQEYQVFREIENARSERDKVQSLKFTVPSENPVYLYINGNCKMNEKYGVEGGAELTVASELGEETGCVVMGNNICLGTFAEGEQLEIFVNTEDSQEVELYDVYLYEMDMQKYKSCMRQLQELQMDVTSWQGGKVTGNIAVPKGMADKVLLVTLPVDMGYSVLVDGKETSYGSVLGTFLSVPISEGEHTIEISYIPYGVDIGRKIGGIAFLMVLFYFIIDVLGKKRNEEKQEG